MNLASVLMCWNIPRISEDLLYELFCNAGPIEEISFAKNGKSCFVVYEHADAVVTAKDIFRDVTLDGLPLTMFDHDEIAKIHSQQEVQVAQYSNYQYENNPFQNFHNNSYEGPYRAEDSRQYSRFNRNAPDHRGSDRYQEMNRRNIPHSSVTPSNQSEVEQDHIDRRANSVRNSSMTCYSRNNSAQSRPDLLPTSSQSSKAREFDVNSTIHDLMNGSNSIFDSLMNPYSMPVSRNPQEVQNHFSNRPSQLDYHEYNSDFPGNFKHGRRSGGTQGEFDHSGGFSNLVNHGDTRHKHRNKYDSNHSNHYRDHPYREPQPDREPFARGTKFSNSSPGANYKSRNPYPRERDYKHKGQQKHRSRRQ